MTHPTARSEQTRLPSRGSRVNGRLAIVACTAPVHRAAVHTSAGGALPTNLLIGPAVDLVSGQRTCGGGTLTRALVAGKGQGSPGRPTPST
jgi:hypothetical protein